jgi:RNA polymerase sigma factor (sigma-70 family)
VLGFLRKRLGDPRLERFVEDVLSEVLVRVFKHYQKCEASTERELVSWVLSIAHNESLRLLARRPLKYALLLGDRDPSETGKGGGPGSGVAVPGYSGYATPPGRDQRSRGLRALLGVLEEVECSQPPERGLILYLKLVEDRSWQEIGEHLEISAGAAKRRYQRAQQTLEKQVLEGVEQLAATERAAAVGFLKRAKLLPE